MTQAHRMQWAGGPFAPLHRAAMGVPIDWTGFDLASFDPGRLELARRVWAERAQTEFRSVQIMTRFLQEVAGAGDPIDVYAGAADMIGDEIRHVALCAEVCSKLGVPARFPSPVSESLPEDYLAAPAADRALSTAIGMLLINETLSVAFIEDLAERCTTPGIQDVLRATIADEAGHEGFGWAYVGASLRRYPESTRPRWQRLVQRTLEPHRKLAAQALTGHESSTLADFPEPEHVALGLHTPQRLAHLFDRTWKRTLQPRLHDLALLP